MKEIKETDMTMQQEPIQENKMGVLPIRPLLLGMACQGNPVHDHQRTV